MAPDNIVLVYTAVAVGCDAKLLTVHLVTAGHPHTLNSSVMISELYNGPLRSYYNGPWVAGGALATKGLCDLTTTTKGQAADNTLPICTLLCNNW